MNYELLASGIAVILLVLVLYYKMYPRATVYRYSKKSCKACIVSESDWMTFKNNMRFKNVKCVDVVLDAPNTDRERESFASQGLRGVPTVVAVFDDGRRFVANGPQIKRLYANVIGSL